MGIVVVTDLAASPETLPPRRYDDCNLAMDQVWGQARQSIVLRIGPSKFNGYVLTLDVADFMQTLTESGYLRVHRCRAIRC